MVFDDHRFTFRLDTLLGFWEESGLLKSGVLNIRFVECGRDRELASTPTEKRRWRRGRRAPERPTPENSFLQRRGVETRPVLNIPSPVFTE